MSVGVRIGVVGVGAMGRNHVRILSELQAADLVGVHDLDSVRAQELASEFGTVAFDSVDALEAAAEAVVLAVPTARHAEIGCRLLEQGLHLLVEKPIASTLVEADRLIAAAAEKVLAVGHVEFFNPAVEALLAGLSQPRFAVVERLSSFTQRSLDVDVILDLMIHDLQILQAMDPSPVREVRAVGVKVLSQTIDIANVRLQFESGFVANVTASRVSGERVRTLRAFLNDRYYSLDYPNQTLTGVLLEPPEEGGTKRLSADRISAIDAPIERGEPLRRELQRFLAACRGERVAYVDGAMARSALACGLQILDAIAASGPQQRVMA